MIAIKGISMMNMLKDDFIDLVTVYMLSYRFKILNDHLIR